MQESIGCYSVTFPMGRQVVRRPTHLKHWLQHWMFSSYISNGQVVKRPTHLQPIPLLHKSLLCDGEGCRAIGRVAGVVLWMQESIGC